MARPRRGTALFRASVVGAGASARDFDRAARQLQDELVRELRNSAVRVTEHVRFFAPEDTERLKDNIEARFYFRASEPRFTVVSGATRDGYPYTAVTRFGHRKSIIRPRHAGALTIHSGPGRSFTRLAGSVRGVGHGTRHVPHDWVSEAMPFVDDEIAKAADRLGRTMTTERLSGRRMR